jgi:hypothetical protein
MFVVSDAFGTWVSFKCRNVSAMFSAAHVSLTFFLAWESDQMCARVSNSTFFVP